jgi:hypothetical protein
VRPGNRLDRRAVIYEASLRGVISDVLAGEFDNCAISTANATTTVRFSPESLRQVLARIQDFGLVLIDLRLRSDPIED